MRLTGFRLEILGYLRLKTSIQRLHLDLLNDYVSGSILDLARVRKFCREQRCILGLSPTRYRDDLI